MRTMVFGAVMFSLGLLLAPRPTVAVAPPAPPPDVAAVVRADLCKRINIARRRLSDPRSAEALATLDTMWPLFCIDITD